MLLMFFVTIALPPILIFGWYYASGQALKAAHSAEESKRAAEQRERMNAIEEQKRLDRIRKADQRARARRINETTPPPRGY